MSAPSTALTPLGQLARALSCVMLGYWGVFAAVAPVLTIDSQMYNLARIELALRDGFFGNQFFTSIFHVIYPWTFDAVHLPFLLLGWGFALPSFLCLAGTCHVVRGELGRRHGPGAGWCAVLGLLAMPCLVYQAAGTKNDLALILAGAVWIHARRNWRQTGSGWHLLWMTLAPAFMAGSKTIGVIPAFVLAAWTVKEALPRAHRPWRVAAGLLAAFFLFGSVETYLETIRQYGHPLGPPALVHRASNHDGLRGAAANFIRHSAGGIYLEQTDLSGAQVGITALNANVRRLLGALGLSDAGADPRFPDEKLFLHQSGMEELSGFGPVGMLALLTLLAAGCIWRPRSAWWPVALAGLLGLALASCTIAYTSWANRYLIPWYALGAVALVCVLFESDASWRRLARWAFVLLAGASALAAPFQSFNRGPRDLLRAFTNREILETSAYPVVGRARDSLRRLKAAAPASRVFFVTHDETVLLPILSDRALGAIPLSLPGFALLQRQGGIRPGDFVVFEGPAANASLELVEQVTAPNVYSFNGTNTQYIYRQTPVAPLRP